MWSAIAALAFAAAVNAVPQGVTSAVAPSSPAPSGCSPDHSGSFEITVVNVTSNAKRDVMKRDNVLILTLSGGTLKDQQGRTGYIASNYQFQFDAPPQAGAIYTSGFSLCGNGSMALGGSAIFYQCYSGGFYNLYDRHWAAQCSPIYIEAIGATGGGSAPPATQASEGQPRATTAATSVSQRTDGQPIATTVPVTQISDGQIQGSPVSAKGDGQPTIASAGSVAGQRTDGQVTASPVSVKGDGQPTVASAGSPAGQRTDGQVTASPVSAKSDGQPTIASAASPVSVKSEGQPTVGTTASPVSVKSEGQPTVGTTASPVSVKSEGQPTVGTTASPVSVKPEGQPTVQAQGSASTPITPPAQFTGAASTMRAAGEAIAAIAGIVGAVALL